MIPRACQDKLSAKSSAFVKTVSNFIEALPWLLRLLLNNGTVNFRDESALTFFKSIIEGVIVHDGQQDSLVNAKNVSAALGNLLSKVASSVITRGKKLLLDEVTSYLPFIAAMTDEGNPVTVLDNYTKALAGSFERDQDDDSFAATTFFSQYLNAVEDDSRYFKFKIEETDYCVDPASMCFASTLLWLCRAKAELQQVTSQAKSIQNMKDAVKTVKAMDAVLARCTEQWGVLGSVSSSASCDLCSHSHTAVA